MENREQQILSEIKSMMASIRSQLELLDARMAELQQCVQPAEEDVMPIDLDITDVMEAAPMPEPVVEPAVVGLDIPEEDDDDLPFEEETAAPEEPVPALEPVYESVPEAEPEPVLQPAAQTPAVPKSREAVIDAMAQRQAWRTDMPGTSVKDIRSAISLNDRIIFINYLFNEDPLLFQDALTKINVMSSLDEVLDFIDAEHPEWNLDSEIVYRFMMAVRRRIR